VPNWQPISTAPKDGTRILCVTGGDLVIAVWDDDSSDRPSWRTRDGEMPWWWYREHQPQYWMPLPEPPKEVA